MSGFRKQNVAGKTKADSTLAAIGTLLIRSAAYFGYIEMFFSIPMAGKDSVMNRM
jgi:hypothetical protein